MLELNHLSNSDIVRLCRQDPDNIHHITLAMADACQKVSEELYIASGRLIELLEADNFDKGNFDEFAKAVFVAVETCKDTHRIFSSANEGAKQAGF